MSRGAQWTVVAVMGAMIGSAAWMLHGTRRGLRWAARTEPVWAVQRAAVQTGRSLRLAACGGERFLLTGESASDSAIANCDMRLGEKIRYLREMEGTLRGLGREMTQLETVRAIKKELGQNLSQSYLSQIEGGKRPHLTNSTRMLLAKFFKVHPGYLVDDPEGYHDELLSVLRASEDSLDMWLINGAERFRRDPEVRHALLQAARHEDSRRCLILMGAILETPQLADRLLEVLKPNTGAMGAAAKVDAAVEGTQPRAAGLHAAAPQRRRS